MKHKKYILILISVLFSMAVTSSGFTEEPQRVNPLLSENRLSTFSGPDDTAATFLTAQNNVPQGGDEDPFEEDLFEDYEENSNSLSVADPLYYFNHAMYSFNDILYFAALKPIATGYKSITPVPVRKGINNFFHNIFFPVRFINTLLQGKLKNAGTEVEIFLINSTVGVLGFAQVAQNKFDLQTSKEDLGQTLGSYSIGNGFYLMLPVFGPSTFRDVLGLVGDSFLNPVNYVEPWELSTGIKVLKTVNTTSLHIGDYEALKASAFDPYVAIKNGYIQRRKEMIKQ